ncbi:unnamed protein product [Sphagnum troendelagicum]|uniref:Senescence domain-containing protein n=1 Tax=Sphagnum troendelagicum TaxID=128251 RepID=A0ABP0U1L0_9BRYO
MGGGFDINFSDSSKARIIAPAGHFVAGQFPNLQDMSMQQGSEVELVKRIRGAQLFLVDGEESVLMQCGDFSIRLLKQAHPSPLAAVVASVGQVQWPVGKDAPILKVWNRRYTFALPGLVYGLLFPEIGTPAIVLQQLESVLDQYCTFQIHQEIAYAAQRQIAANRGRDFAAKYWTAVAPDVETMSSRIARQICSTSTIVVDSIMMAGEWASLGIQQAGGAANFVKRKLSVVAAAAAAAAGGDDHVIMPKNPRILKRIQQAQRMSAVAKLMSKTLLKGAIRVSTHVATGLADLNHVQDDAPASLRGAQLGHQTSAAGLVESAAFPGAAKPSVAVASVDAFAKVVEVVETAGKSLYAATKAVGTNLVQQRFGTDAGQMMQDSFGVVGNAIDTAWTLNKLGLSMLLQATAASTILSTTSTGTAAAGSSKTKKPYIPTTLNNLQQQPPAASSMHLFPSKSEQQQLEAGLDAEHQTLLQSAASHQQEQEPSSAKNLAAAGSGHANLFTDAENDVSSLPQTHVFLGPAIQHPNAVSSFTPSYIPHQPKNACDAPADSSYIPHQPKKAFDVSANSCYISHQPKNHAFDASADSNILQQPKNAFEQFNLFQNYDLGVQARSESPSIFNFPFSLNRKE